MINLVKSGVGNLKSITNVLNYLDIKHTEVSKPEEFTETKKIILPGVGSFDSFIHSLKERLLFGQIKKLVEYKNYEILGICVGMQSLFSSSEEGNLKGFEFIDGYSRKFPNEQNFKIPHMGWNYVNFIRSSKISVSKFKERYYFANSYYVDCAKKYHIAISKHSIDFPSVVKMNNIYGVQFHPEKSYDQGMKIIKNFCSYD